MRFIALPIVLAAVAACSTVSARRDDPPTLDVLSHRSLPEFQECFAAAVANVTPPPAYLPRGVGGTYTYTVSNYVLWVLDIEPEGTGLRLKVYSPRSVRGRDHDAQAYRRLVQGCL